MKKIEQALLELRNIMRQISICNSLIQSYILFFILVLAFMLVSIRWYVAAAPFAVYLALHLILSKKALSYKYAEERAPLLKEQLRTAADNIHKENEIVESLNQEVLKRMKEIRTSYFFSFGKLTRQLITLTLLSFAIISVSAYDVQLLDARDVAKLVPLGELGEFVLSEELPPLGEENETADIYGNKSVAELGTKELTLEINPVMSEIDLRKVKDPEKKEFQDDIPREIAGTTDASYEEQIPKGYQQVVKNYYKEISKTKQEER